MKLNHDIKNEVTAQLHNHCRRQEVKVNFVAIILGFHTPNVKSQQVFSLIWFPQEFRHRCFLVEKQRHFILDKVTGRMFASQK